MNRLKRVFTILLILLSTNYLTYGNSICENWCFDTCNRDMENCENAYRNQCQDVLDDTLEDVTLAWAGFFYGLANGTPGGGALAVGPVISDLYTNPRQIRQAEMEYNGCITMADRNLQGCLAGCEND